MISIQNSIAQSFLLSCTENMNEVILEVHAGVGGLEAGLFAAEMFRMYQRWVSLLVCSCLLSYTFYVFVKIVFSHIVSKFYVLSWTLDLISV